MGEWIMNGYSETESGNFRVRVEKIRNNKRVAIPNDIDNAIHVTKSLLQRLYEIKEGESP